jgi:hypothetical protein
LTKYAEYFERYQQRYRAQMRQLAATFSTDCGAGPPGPARVLQNPLFAARMRDAWGTTLRVERVNMGAARRPTTEVRSAGPDKQFGTADDLTGYLEVLRGRKPVGRSSRGSQPNRLQHRTR